ncbi:MAG TPA: 50S ribosomal protein L23 [Rhodocyclaceae bacterium]|nr:50S ribosomal protein L23 [Rhodocyclaceae bacterium]
MKPRYTEERLLQVLLAPQISEKATFVADKYNQVIFRVAPDATKPEIKAAVELVFGRKDKPIDVLSVTVSNTHAKIKRRGRIQGRRSGWKKAFVRLAPDQELNFAEGGSL